MGYVRYKSLGKSSLAVVPHKREMVNEGEGCTAPFNRVSTSRIHVSLRGHAVVKRNSRYSDRSVNIAQYVCIDFTKKQNTY